MCVSSCLSFSMSSVFFSFQHSTSTRESEIDDLSQSNGRVDVGEGGGNKGGGGGGGGFRCTVL